jgi:hypothetical protein
MVRYGERKSVGRAESNGKLDRKIEFIADAMGHLAGTMDKLAKSQDLLVRSIRAREESTRLRERADQLWKVVGRDEQYRRHAAGLRDFLLWEDAT